MKQVVIIEDERNIRKFISVNLRARGMNVTEYGSVEEALPHMSDGPPDAIVLDLLLPGMTGVELLEVMSATEELRTIPVVIVSASMEVLSTNGQTFDNVRDVLAKPVGVNQLVEAVRAALTHSDGKVSEDEPPYLDR